MRARVYAGTFQAVRVAVADTLPPPAPYETDPTTIALDLHAHHYGAQVDDTEAEPGRWHAWLIAPCGTFLATAEGATQETAREMLSAVLGAGVPSLPCALCGAPGTCSVHRAAVVHGSWPRHARRVLARGATVCAVHARSLAALSGGYQ